MNAGQHESSSFRERAAIRSHSPYCEAKGPIVEKGFVASRIRAIHEAFNQKWVSSWSHSPMTSCPLDSKLHKYESYSPAQLRPAPKASQRPSILSANRSIAGSAKPLPEVDSPTKWTNKYSRASSCNNIQKWLQDDVLNSRPVPFTRQITAEDGRNAQIYNIEGSPSQCSAIWIDDLESGRLVEQPESSTGEELDNTNDNATELRCGVNSEYTATPTSSLCLDDTNADMKPTQSQSLHLQPSKDPSLRSLAKKSLTSLLFTTDNGLTSAKNSPRPKKFQIRRKAKKQAISHTPTDASQMTNTLETELPLSHTLTSPKDIRRAFSFQPQSKSKSSMPEPIELRPTSADPTLNRLYNQCAVASSDQISAGHSFNTGVPQEPSGRNKPPRHSISNGLTFPRRFSSSASIDPLSPLSGPPSAQIRKRWSGWKLRPTEKQSEFEKILEKGPDLLQRSASPHRDQNDDTSPAIEDSTAQHAHGQHALDERLALSVSEREQKCIVIESDLTPQAENSANADKNRRPKPNQPHPPSSPPKASATSTNASPEPHHASLQQPRPQHPQLHHHVSGLVANLPRESSPAPCSPGAASPAPLHADSPSRSPRWGHRAQRITRIQVIVSLDGSADALSDSSLERMGKKFF